jgi:two-component system, response regulator YesN
MRIRKILVVDDEPRSREGMKKMLGAWGAGEFEILTADNGASALQIIEETAVDLMITDIRMPGMTGISLVSQMKQRKLPHEPTVILISGYAEFEYAQQAIQLSVVNYLLKPVSKDKLIAAVEEALTRSEERNRIGMMRKMVDPELMAVSGEEAALSDQVKFALQFVEDHMDEAIGLKEIAELVHLNASYFSSLFKDQIKVTFSEYVTRRRLQKAKELLLKTNLPIAEISERIGYQTAKYFNKVFKEYEKVSPGQYRSAMHDQEQY